MLNETNAETTRLRQRESSCRHAIFPGISIIIRWLFYCWLLVCVSICVCDWSLGFLRKFRSCKASVMWMWHYDHSVVIYHVLCMCTYHNWTCAHVKISLWWLLYWSQLVKKCTKTHVAWFLFIPVMEVKDRFHCPAHAEPHFPAIHRNNKE